MPFTSGTFGGVANTFNDAVAGQVIDPDDWNELFTDIEVGINAAASGTGSSATTDVVSAATCNIGAAATRVVRITGSTGPITSLGTVANTRKYVYFASTPTLTHHGTSLILPGAANITAAAGDAALFISDASGNWRCHNYMRAANVPATISAFMATVLDDTTAAAARATLSDTVRAITGADTVIATDWGRTLTVSGSFTLALTATATLGSGFWFEVRNIGSRRVPIDPNGVETINGASTLALYPGQNCIVFGNGTTFYTIGLPERWRLTATTTIYASTTGVATNDGLDAAAPLTPQLAQAFIRNSIDQAGNNLIIQLADASYNTANGFSQFAGDWFGHHNIEIWGNSADVGAPTSVTLAPTNSGDNALYVTDKCRVVVRYINFAGHASANHIKVEQFAVVGADSCRFAGCNVAIQTRINGQFKTNGVCYFGGTHAVTFQSTEDGEINIGASNHIIESGYASTTCAVANGGQITVDPGASFNTGPGYAGATGTRYAESNGGHILGNSASLFPGDVAGTSTNVDGPAALTSRAEFFIPVWNASGVLQTTGAAATVAGALEAAAAQYVGWAGRSVLKSPADGNVTLLNQAGSSFGLLQGGGTSSSFPAWKRSSATWVARLADDTANATITVGNIFVVASTGDAVFQVDSSAGGANDINGMLIKRGGNNKWQILNNLAGSSTDEFTIRHAATNTVVVQITKDTAYETTFTAGAVKSTHATAGLGYGTGAGGTVVQGAGSGKATGVTLNKSTGEITMNNATLNAATTVSFTLTNSAIAATDLILIWHVSAGTLGSYTVTATPASGSASIAVRNITAGNLGEAIVLKFAVFKAATS